ncbi:hypothetical protein BT63DRAFT_25666 [Microthyrium microscopicum]|uniref:Uncharacterized protein n=1 Tax=Microthyrium microscopicum TaxID=703497 RepID=A0A6A6UV79_9PEZI|nr:hypothetical protein BT63DRAFT_25666 [Microthyrium microscopicum]
MSDLAPGVGPSSSGRATNGGARPQGAVPVSQGQQAKLTTPTDIMRRRREREEAKQQAEAAAQGQTTPTPEQSSQRLPERLRTDERPDIPIGQPRTQQPHRRATSEATPGQGPPSYAPTGQPSASASGAGGSFNPRTGQPTSQSQDPSIPGRPRANTQGSGQSRPVPPSSQQPGTQRYSSQQQNPSASGQPQPRVSAQSGPSVQRPSAPTSSAGSMQPAISNFPHAFERWETLSSHWEGLTSYWIRRLEQNTEELRREPLLQQLSRQVTDLSAAGANLFHGVVELQKLRASSERKFQRWFYETRKETERQQEVAAQYEQALVGERRAHAADLSLLQGEIDSSHSTIGRLEKQLSEMQREQHISKEEARRAWEELGRREQEARDQVTALREGQPILVGGIQVFPTAHQTSGRQQSMSGAAPGGSGRPTTRDGSGAPPAMSGVPEGAYGQPILQGSPTHTDPFTEHGGMPRTQPSATNGMHTSAPEAFASPSGGAGFYQQPTSYLHGAPGHRVTAPGTEETFSSDHDEDDYEYDEHGRPRTDVHGNPIVWRRGHPILADDDDEDTADDIEHERAMRAKYGPNTSTAVSYPQVPAPTSARINPVSAPTTAGAVSVGPSHLHPATAGGAGFGAPVDYEGEGYEDSDFDVNQYPSRLSIVDEVDEEASRASEISGRSGRHTPRQPPF